VEQTQAIPGRVNIQFAQGRCTLHHRTNQGVAHLLLNRVAHRPRTEFGMESFADQEGEDGLGPTSGGGRAPLGRLEFTAQELFGDLQLVVVREAMEDQLLVDSGEDFGPQSLLGAGQDVALQGGLAGVLKAHQLGGADV
jgi:hypothetical protein